MLPFHTGIMYLQTGVNDAQLQGSPRPKQPQSPQGHLQTGMNDAQLQGTAGPVPKQSHLSMGVNEAQLGGRRAPPPAYTSGGRGDAQQSDARRAQPQVSTPGDGPEVVPADAQVRMVL